MKSETVAILSVFLAIVGMGCVSRKCEQRIARAWFEITPDYFSQHDTNAMGRIAYSIRQNQLDICGNLPTSPLYLHSFDVRFDTSVRTPYSYCESGRDYYVFPDSDEHVSAFVNLLHQQKLWELKRTSRSYGPYGDPVVFSGILNGMQWFVITSSPDEQLGPIVDSVRRKCEELCAKLE